MNRNMEAITWALHARGISPTAFRLLVQLCSFVNSNRDDFCVWPSHKLLAEKVEISTSGVKRHLRELEEVGYIEARPNARHDGGKTANVYSIMVESTHRLPGGVQVKVTQPIVQSGRGGQVTGEPSPQVTAEPCNEPLNDRTSEIMKGTPQPPEGAGEGDDLFGQPPALIGVSDQQFADLFVEMWNGLAAKVPKLPNAKPLRNENVKSLMARLREAKASKSIDDARALIALLLSQFEGSRLLRGEGDRGWVPAATWLLGKQNFGKVVDGFYVQDAAAGADRPKSRDERSFMDAGLAARDVLRARDRAAPQTLRQIAGLDPRSPSYDRR